jgi:hypothetical protein
MQYIILGSDDSHKVQAFGSMTGRPFISEHEADKAKRKLERLHPRLDWLVLPLVRMESALLEIHG